MKKYYIGTSLLAILIGSLAAAPAVAQGDGLGNSDEIIVTARKRDESLLAVPVIVTAMTGTELERRAINSSDSLARMVPGLTIGEGGGTVQGGTIALRGVAGPDTNPFGDQAVSFNIDGVQVAKSSVRRLGFMDVQQIEVLKGPQALFFGKNSPGGIISLRTSDPTSSFSAKAALGYEFNAHEVRGEGHVSGPLTDTLGARLAFYGSDMRGWVKSLVPANNAYVPFHRFGPRNREIALRGTLKLDPNDRFSARLKVAYGDVKGAGPNDNSQIVKCPYGANQLPGIAIDCKPDERNNRTDNIGPRFTPFQSKFGDGHTWLKQHQTLAGLELNYKLSDAIDITSVTGLYHTKLSAVEHYTRYPGDPILMFGFTFGDALLPVYLKYMNREISQELRASTSFDGPFNFTIGGIYSDTRSSTGSHAFLNATSPIELTQYFLVQNGIAYSVFGQGRFDVTDQLELSAGGRYSREKKSLPVTKADFTSSAINGMTSYVSPVNKVSFDNFSPELTLNYRPTQNLTVFGSYKRGFLSGGFNSSSAVPGVPINYGPQKIRGYEGGVKASLLGGALRANLSAFSYKVAGLQITAFEQGGVIGTIRNAGGVKIKGLEFDANYRTPIDGLSLRGAVSYNHARYTEYFGPCWAGQSQSMGCSFLALGGGEARPIQGAENGNLQDLAGNRLVNAPEWSGSIGASFDTPIGRQLKFGISADLNFASSSPTDATSYPNAVSPSRQLLDASLRIGDVDDQWELALIGRNLTNDFYWSNGQQHLFTGGESGGVNPGALADATAVINRAREIMLRFTFKFGQ